MLKNYIDKMFSGIEDSPEARKAKSEITQMMEDKYESLKDEGYTDNEALGKVISEFGNIDELKEGLGLNTIYEIDDEREGTFVTNKELGFCITRGLAHSIMVGVGVLLCILGVFINVLFDMISKFVTKEFPFWAIGIASMFVMIGVAVVLFVVSGLVLKYNNKYYTPIYFDESGDRIYKSAKKSADIIQIITLSVGIFLCIASIIAPIVTSSISSADAINELGAFIMGAVVSAGVGIIVFGGNYKSNIYALGKTQKTKKVITYKNKKIEFIMSVYYQTVTALYLMISFILWNFWGITWVIFPLAYLIKSIIDLKFGGENNEA